MDGIYLSALIPLLREKIKDSPCTAAGMTSSSTLSLRFRQTWLHLHARPDDPGLWITGESSVVPPASPAWEHHLNGASVVDVRQQGADRVLEIEFLERTHYDKSGVTLIFEAAGRNSNIILVRNSDSRILACLRKILPEVNRYRTVSPGVVYRQPPPSGYHPEEWGSREVQELLKNEVTPRLLCRTLEGVGPGSAKAILGCSPDVSKTVRELGEKMVRNDFFPWHTPFGNVPVKLGSGEPVPNPLAPPKRETSREGEEEYRPSTTELRLLIERKIVSESKRIESSETSLNKLKSPDELRNIGNLLLTFKKELRKGMKQAVLRDWEDREVTIELKQSLNPAENAGRYFRKAGRIHLERTRLEEKRDASVRRVRELEEMLRLVDTMDDSRAARLLQKMGKTEKKEVGGPLEYILHGGWRCLAGRNAVQNDRLTFKMAGRDDIWMHARGVAGAHVILKRDGRADNPSAQVLQEAAQVAAKHSTTNGMVPVDWTLARYVRRMKGAGPGQVVYTREKTIFAEKPR